jgi:hypothetical protein
MKAEDVKALVALRMEQSDEMLRDARNLLKDGSARSVVNRAYYSAFYAVVALLQTAGETPKRHTGALSLFDMLFVKPGEFSKEFSDILHKLLQARIEDDYKKPEPVPIDEAKECLHLAERFTLEISKYLRARGYLQFS